MFLETAREPGTCKPTECVQPAAISAPKELAESEETSASVSRGLFLAYMRNAHGGGGGRDGGVVSLERWLEDRQAAIKKVRHRSEAAPLLSTRQARGSWWRCALGWRWCRCGARSAPSTTIRIRVRS